MLTEKKTWLWKGKPLNELTHEELLEAAEWMAPRVSQPARYQQLTPGVAYGQFANLPSAQH